AIMEADWCVGELLSMLEERGLLENTLIIFSSDNGPVLNDGYKDGAAEMLGDHKPAGVLRGGKYSLFDAGTHVPFFAYWKGNIEPIKSSAFVSQMDILASVAELVGVDIPEELDSESHLDAFMGKSDTARDGYVVEAMGRLAYRKGDYAMIPPFRGQKSNASGNELGNIDHFALYNLSSDPAQETDISAIETEVLESLKTEFLTLTDGYYNPNTKEEKLK
ncbi:MAG: sulfatase-like hydrolase/transferase, partial [Rikenellaceae bacterium]